MRAAQWHAADPLSLRSRLEIASAAVFEHPYDDAPVSNLYLWGRNRPAFEQPVQLPVTTPPRALLAHRQARSGWSSCVGGCSHFRCEGWPQLYHRPNHEDHRHRRRAHPSCPTCTMNGELQEEVYFIDDFHHIRQGEKNGGGDPWFTDGRLEVGVIVCTECGGGVASTATSQQPGPSGIR